MYRSKKVVGVALIAVALTLLSACGLGGSQEPTATAVDLNLIYTQVAQTVVAQQNVIIEQTTVAQQTLAALASPTPDVTLTPTASLTPLNFSTITPLATSPLVGQPVVPGCDNLTYIQDLTHPDGESIGRDQEILKIWRVKNSGTCDWTDAYKVSWAGGDAIGGAYAIRVDHVIKPGQTYDIEFTMRTPKNKGKVSGLWRMQNAEGQFFGDWLSCTLTIK